MLIEILVPETAGRTIGKVLEHAFGDRLHVDNRDRVLAQDPAAPPTRPSLETLRSEVPSHTECIAGAFLATKYDELFPSAPKHLWLRHPIQRLLAHYHFWRLYPDDEHPVCSAMHREGWDVAELAAHPILRNVYTRFLGGLELDRFEAIGIAESYDRSLALLQRRFGLADWPGQRLVMGVERVAFEPRTGRSRIVEYPVEPATLRRLEEYNDQDLTLYERARNRFAELCEQQAISATLPPRLMPPSKRSSLVVVVTPAGTSGNPYIHALNLQFGKGARCTSPDGDVPEPQSEANCIHGNFRMTRWIDRYPLARHGMWFRDPVERVAALYREWRKVPDPNDANARKLVDEDLDLPRFARLADNRNVMARCMGGVHVEELRFVGMVEDYERSLWLHQQVNGWRQNLQLLFTFPSESTAYDAPTDTWRIEPHAVPDDVKAEIYKLNALDVAILARARDWFEVLCSLHGVQGRPPRLLSRPNPRNDLLVHVHMPKTGGLSVNTLLESAFGANVIFRSGVAALSPLGDRIRCISGHFTSAWFQPHYPNAKTAIWFRDPVDRLVSHYQFTVRFQERDEPYYNFIRNHRPSLADFARYSPNHQSAYAGSRPIDSYAFIGITEQFDRSLELFRRVFGVAGKIAEAPVNVNPEKPVGRGYDLDAATRAAVERHNQKDRALYTRALERFEQLCAQYAIP